MRFGKTRSKSTTTVLTTPSNGSSPNGTSPNVIVPALPPKVSSLEHTEQFGLFHLNPIPTPPKGGESAYKIDVVALHGIKGHAYNTWTDKNGNFWLRDQLPNELPGARIFSFGYDANVVFSRGTGTVEEFAMTLLEHLIRERDGDANRKRQIIFICHSMGGIVIKKALTKASENNLYKNVFDSTFAILFLATPHLGSDETKLPLSIANVANCVLSFPMRFSGRVRDELITPLARGSPFLRDTQNKFKEKKLYERMKIASFLEMDICAGLKGLVVDNESAQLHVPNERVMYMLGRDHRNICRFSGPESSSYKTVWGILKGYADQANIMVPDELTPEDEAVLSSIHYPEMAQRCLNAAQAYPNTCTWIFKNPAYLLWKDTSRGLIWIKGKPGAGKSTLMAFILSHRDPRHLVLNFFFHGRGSSLQKSPEGMYRELLYQLYSYASPIRDKLRQSFAEKNASRQSENDCIWAEDELRDWLFNAITWISTTQPVTIFVDALDEAGDDNARMLIDYFDEMKKRVSRDGGTLRICISCRHYPNVTLSDGFEVNVENFNMRDIAVFVHAKLDSKVLVWDNDPVAIEGRVKMEEAIVKKSQGVFQWVKLVVPRVAEELNEGASLKDIHVMLEKVQEDLGAVYENILTNIIKVEYRSKSLLLMQWVALAERPLTATELRIAIACDEGSHSPGHKRWEDSKDYIESDRRMETLMKSLSGGLVEIALYTSGLYRVQFIHQTVVDFMLSGGLLFLVRHSVPHEIGICGIDLQFSNAGMIGQSQDRLSRSCVNYFKQSDITSTNFNNTTERDKVCDGTIYPLFKYAVENWSIHAEKAERLGFCQTHVVEQLEDPPGYFEKYIEYEYALKEAAYSLRKGSVILHLMASANLQGPARLLLDRGDSVEDEDQGSVRPLHCASFRGHKEMVQILLDAGADIKATQDGRHTALEIAASKAHDNVLQLLLERGADINAVSNTGTALEGAASSGDIRLVRKLLDLGCDVNREGRFGSTPLKAAARKGSIEVVHLLLELGADINHCEDYGTPLQIAALAGHIEVCRVLLSHGALVNTPGFSGTEGSALQCAANNNSIHNSIDKDIELLQLLLDHGADINALDSTNRTALSVAVNAHGRAEGKNSEIDPRILFLLSNGADVNAGASLVYAARRKNIKLIALLLDRGADINIMRSHESVLAAACSAFEPEPEMIKLLLDKGADINLYCEMGGITYNGTALQCAVNSAARTGDLRIIHILLDNGANINLGAGKTGGALYEAAERGHLELCRIFLSLGADVHAEQTTSGIALHAAARSGNVDVIALLLAHGAHIDDERGLYGTPLQVAAQVGHVDAFKLLVNSGADVHHIGGNYHNMLISAAWGGSIECVESCLDRGLDVNARGGSMSDTALCAAAHNGHVDVVSRLLDAGAKEFSEGWWGSAWCQAERYGHRAVLKVLKENGLERKKIKEDILWQSKDLGLN
ncbi:hypothetical protein NHQ30_005952 [Ciborinia camelliae]|nr:hypothetical protein NHQ30_005952 [Ciborinia camelliae]